MGDDRRRPGEQASRRDDALRRWIADEVHPYSAPLRERLDRSGLGRRGVRGASDLARLPVVELEALGDGRGWVLEPTADRIRTEGAPELRARLLVSDVVGGRDTFSRRHVDLPYKPVAWTAARHADGVLLTGWTTTDLDQLGVLGRRALAVSGVVPEDRVADVGAGAGIGALQLELGARDAGVPHVRIGPDEAVGVLPVVAPSVLTGPPATLLELAGGGLPASIRLLVAQVGPEGAGVALRRLRRHSPVPVRLWWAPAGVRAAWASCEVDQLHTWPEHEHLEVVDDAGTPSAQGRLVWSAVGWRGSVWLRVALGPDGRIEHERCRCGRTTPRVLGARRPAAAGVDGR
ncbi:MAG TPA: hypothetical protein VFV42_10225 [Acidimicrobiales bacterium]|nr:hypothetical protein [Acidimicrobiales bacterium]